MASANPWRGSGAVEFVETAARRRAMVYQERAAHLSAMADAEPNSFIRAKLLHLVDQYEKLAASIELNVPRPALGG